MLANLPSYHHTQQAQFLQQLTLQHMSTISTDWKSVSVAGANAAIRNSIAAGSRSSSFASLFDALTSFGTMLENVSLAQLFEMGL